MPIRVEIFESLVSGSCPTRTKTDQNQVQWPSS
jgi:hypothetical protein